ncbi:AI-2E family transporter [Pedobacter sp. MW01-1-1]|uniref:AI-2E family transporter n=1 Tax=Pedobacter sp. MW01-1-1 TaxID=3383027 RepID=UPI003FEDA7A1
MIIKDQKLAFLPKLALVLFCLISLTYIAILGQTLLAPLLFSFLMAILLYPLANFLEKKFKFKRSLSTTTSVVLMVVVIGSILYFFSNQLSALWAEWPQLKAKGDQSYHELKNWLSHSLGINDEKQMTYINDSAEKALATSAIIITATLATLSSMLLFLAFTLLFTFFMLNYRRVLVTFLITVIKEEHKEKVNDIVLQIQFIIKKYIIGLFLQMVIVASITIIILTCLGIKYSVLLGLIAGIFNVIPYLGILFALVVSCLITLATAGLSKVLFVLIAFIFIHTIDGNILMPLVVGSKVKINALIAFVGIVIGEMVWGISGMFLCIPYLAMLKIIFDRTDHLKPWGLLMGEDHSAEIKPEKTE